MQNFLMLIQIYRFSVVAKRQAFKKTLLAFHDNNVPCGDGNCLFFHRAYTFFRFGTLIIRTPADARWRRMPTKRASLARMASL